MPKTFFAALLILMTCTPGPPQKAPPIFFNYDKDGFSATGEWVTADTKKSSSIPSETEIDCFKISGSCVEGMAEFYSGHPHVTISYLQVIKWDENEIIASDSSGVCMTVTMRISFAEKRISSTHSMKQLDDKLRDACKFFGATKTEEDIFILKGSERWTKEHSYQIPGRTEKP